MASLPGSVPPVDRPDNTPTSNHPPVLPPLSLDISDDILAAANDFIPTSFSSEQADEVAEPASAGAAHKQPINSPSTQSSNTKLLPIPTPTANHTSPSPTSFILQEAGSASVVATGEHDQLPPEIAKADIAISADGKFVQTTSALAARELKKIYDRMLGVGQGATGVVRSPYAISAIQEEDGTTVFRVGHRDANPTSEDSVSPEMPHVGHATGTRRKARLSVQDFLPSSMFKPSAVEGGISGGGTLPRNNTAGTAVASGSTPPVITGMTSTTSPQSRRKLRKTRSNSDLAVRIANASSPPSVSMDSSGHLSPPPRMESFLLEVRDELTAGADAFNQVLGWTEELASDPVPSSRKGAKASVPPTPDDTYEASESSNVDAFIPRRPSVSTSAALSSNADIPSSPFGDNVRYTAPMRRSVIHLDAQSPQLREMQSFESGLTAKAGDTPKFKDKSHAPNTVTNQAHFSTKVFEVLQTYRGLPLPSALLAAPPMGATIKMSTTDSANPKDDPRFVIWGEIQPEGTVVDDASMSSHTDLSNPGSSSGPHRKRSNARAPDTPAVAVSPENGVQTVIIAATVERWIAQLTSELNYDELLNFLLTYRTYISPVDLCHLLICRFHWALELPTSKQDETVRRIIRVRTFAAIKYWLSTFFREDFLPNPQLCHLFAGWLNALSKDPHLKHHPDALSIVRKLKKLVRDCKAEYTRNTRPVVSSEGQYSSVKGAIGDLNGTSEGKGKGRVSLEESDDSDVELDFSNAGHANALYDVLSGEGNTMGTPMTFGEGASVLSSSVSSTKQPGLGASSTNSILLSQPLSRAILGHLKSGKPGTEVQGPAALPIQHSAISRAFVNTMGRLGRWKRVLNARSSVVPTTHCADMSAFDLEPNGRGDLLMMGLEEYVKMLNLTPPQLPAAPVQTVSTQSEPSSAVDEVSKEQIPKPEIVSTVDNAPKERAPESGISSTIDDTAEELIQESEANDTQSVPQGDASIPALPPGLEALVAPSKDSAVSQDDTEAEAASSYITRDSRGSFFTESETAPESDISPMEPPSQPDWAPEVVSLDDYDLSDSDSSVHSAAQARKLPRRLPLRRDFQFVRNSATSVSSLGVQSNSSMSASSFRSGSRGSVLSERESVVEASGRPVAAVPVESWHLELISDDEEEAGDAEAALRRLEGQIDVERQREKEQKIGRWLQSAAGRNPREFGHERARESISSLRSDSQYSEVEDDENREGDSHAEQTDNEDITVSVRTSMSETESPMQLTEDNTPSTATQPSYTAPVTGDHCERDRSTSVSSSQGGPITSRPNSMEARRPSLIATAPRPLTSQFGSPNIPSSHRSFIFMHKTETLAQQFTIIEAELFSKIRFEEVVSHQWGQSLEDVDVRDWVQFVKERAKLKNSLAGKPTTDPVIASKLSAILALRARFDLMVNFVASEVLLTPFAERPKLIMKLIRLAWKLYLHNNFGTLVALMSGLQTRWVNQAMGRQWHKISVWEQRVFEDLRWFASRVGQFKFIRKATAAIIDARPLQSSGLESSSSVSGPTINSSGKAKAIDTKTSCVPFLGAYLAQLYEYEKLPDFIDPTAPAEPVLIDNDTGTLSAPAHPEVFFNLQALPEELPLEPLINVHKQRLIAGVIKSLVGGQHLATTIPFEVDQKCYQRCFRLRSLTPEALHSIATKSSTRPRRNVA